MAPVRAEKKIDFSNSKIGFSEKIAFKNIFDLKTIYFAYKPISDGLF